MATRSVMITQFDEVQGMREYLVLIGEELREEYIISPFRPSEQTVRQTFGIDHNTPVLFDRI